MKTYVYTILLLLLIASACRSNRSLDKVSQTLSQTESNVSVLAKDSAASQTNKRDSVSNITTEQQFIRTVSFRPDGTIQSIQEEWRGSRRDELAVSDTGSSDVHLSETQKDSTVVNSTQAKEIKHEESKDDTRPVQGEEWFWIMLPICIIVILALIFLAYRYRDKLKKLFKK